MFVFERAKSDRSAQVVARRIREAVLSGRISVGDKLPNERQLIEQFGYSRAVIREALRLLEGEGLIELHAGRNGGAVITSPGNRQITSNIDTVLRLRSTSVKEVHEAQRLVEPLVVQLAAERATPEDLDKVRETIALIENDPGNIELVRLQSNRFHTLLGEATGNNVVAIIAAIVRQIVIDLEYEGTADEALAIARIHRRILEAIERRDVDAAKRRSLRHIDASESMMCGRSSKK